jgi:hypothetical protein
MLKQLAWWGVVLLSSMLVPSHWQRSGWAGEDSKADSPEASSVESVKEPGTNLVRLTKDYPIWIDSQRKLVLVDGVICLREGLLEMFACPRGTKEHESIVAVDCKAQYVHAALLAVGAMPGQPVQ